MTMNKLDTMIAIKAEVFKIQERLNSTDAQVVKVAMEGKGRNVTFAASQLEAQRFFLNRNSNTGGKIR